MRPARNQKVCISGTCVLQQSATEEFAACRHHKLPLLVPLTFRLPSPKNPVEKGGQKSKLGDRTGKHGEAFRGEDPAPTSNDFRKQNSVPRLGGPMAALQGAKAWFCQTDQH